MLSQLDGILKTCCGINTENFFSELSDAISIAKGDPSGIFSFIEDAAGAEIIGFVSFLSGGWVVLPFTDSQVQSSQGQVTMVVYP